MEGASTSEIIASQDVVTQMMPPPLSCVFRRGPRVWVQTQSCATWTAPGVTEKEAEG
jgi:hypothetical protein